MLDRSTLNLTSLVLDEPSTPGWFKKGEVEALIKYYVSLDLVSFRALETPTTIETGPSVSEEANWPHVIAKGVYSSIAIHEAITDAFSDLTLVSGEADEKTPAGRKFTTTAYVAVASDLTVAGIKLVEPSTPNYFKKGEVEALITFYLSLTVSEINDLDVPVFDLNTGPSVEEQKQWAHVIPGGIYTSIAVYEAITRALATL